MRNTIFSLLLLGAFSLTFISNAQQIKVDANISSSRVFIGDQVELKLTAEHSKDVTVQWPLITDSLGKLELISKNKADTISKPEDPVLKERKTYILTSFDSGLYSIQAFRFTYKKGNDTGSAATNPLQLTVFSPKVDTTQAIKDIKKPLDVPFTWREAAPYIAGVVILAIIAYLIYRVYQKRKQGKPVFIPETPPRPSYEIALEQLSEVEKEKLWQSGQTKQYHSRIADILRVYIEARFRISAMEQTSEETLSHFKSGWITEQSREHLTQILRLSDLVKFAKYQPVPDENQLSLRNAYEFINTTKPVIADQTERKTEV